MWSKKGGQGKAFAKYTTGQALELPTPWVMGKIPTYEAGWYHPTIVNITDSVKSA